MNHFIPLETAIQMTTQYRQEKENILADAFKGQNILALCETFDRAAFDSLLGEADCTSIRLYYGMGDDFKIHVIGVSVNSNDEDILPTQSKTSVLTNPPVIIEEAYRCPDHCPPKSPLNP